MVQIRWKEERKRRKSTILARVVIENLKVRGLALRKDQGGFLVDRAVLRFEVGNFSNWTENSISTNREYFTGRQIEISTVYFSTALHSE